MTTSERSRAARAVAAAALWLALAPAAAGQGAAQLPDPRAHLDGEDCLRCHQPLEEKIELPVPHLPAAAGECVLCHSPHAARYPKLLNRRERALCGVCHAERIGEFLKGSVHTPIKEGQCTACHEVHGSEHEHLLVREGAELCLGCHEEKAQQTRMPVVHAPYEIGECLDCHEAHNSPFPSQLAGPAQNLCQACHDSSDAALVEAHSGIPIQGTNCVTCHEPHASLSKGLLRRVVHEPFRDASCEMCHLLESDTPQLVRAVGVRLCRACHGDYPRKGDTVVHKPVGDGECGSCHLPHTGNVKGLLPGPSQELCSSCHAELVQRAEASKSAHPVSADKGACLACHAPHSSTEPHLLVSGEIRTCLGCHETAKHGHPLGDDRIDPRTGQPITCVTCHDPHGTAFAYQLRGDQSRGLCIECHNPRHDGAQDAKGSGKRN